MKIITFVMHDAVKQSVLDRIADLDGILGCYLCPADAYFEGIGLNPFETSRDLVSGFTPRVRIDILVHRAQAPEVMEHLLECRSCAKGRGIWYMRDVEEWGAL